MKVAVLCEYSGIVRDAFLKRGHNAISCDVLPTESEGPHIQGDLFDYDWSDYDLIIAHPPCTYLSNAGIGWFNEEKYGDKARERKIKRLEAFEFVMKIYNLPVDKIAIENPVGWINSHFRKPDQIIQPYQFGETESKRTCLWLKGLPKLEHTKIVEPKIYGYFKKGKKKGQPIYGVSYCKFSEDRGKIRSKFFVGIAEAMADQWGIL